MHSHMATFTRFSHVVAYLAYFSSDLRDLSVVKNMGGAGFEFEKVFVEAFC